MTSMILTLLTFTVSDASSLRNTAIQLESFTKISRAEMTVLYWHRDSIALWMYNVNALLLTLAESHSL